MSIRTLATATALLALVAASPVLAQQQPADQPQAGQSQDSSKPADQSQEKKQ